MDAVLHVLSKYDDKKRKKHEQSVEIVEICCIKQRWRTVSATVKDLLVNCWFSKFRFGSPGKLWKNFFTISRLLYFAFKRSVLYSRRQKYSFSLVIVYRSSYLHFDNALLLRCSREEFYWNKHTLVKVDITKKNSRSQDGFSYQCILCFQNRQKMKKRIKEAHFRSIEV